MEILQIERGEEGERKRQSGVKREAERGRERVECVEVGHAAP